MDTAKVIIDKPCAENWDNMLPNEQGRHCLKCCKTVVDFTNWQTEDIIHYISSSSKSVCGQLKASQVATKEVQQPFLSFSFLKKIAAAQLPYWKKIAAVIALFFGLSTQQELLAQNKNKPTQKHQPEPPQPMILGNIAPPQQKDTLPPDPVLLGEVIAPPPADTTVRDKKPEHVRGKVKAPGKKVNEAYIYKQKP